MVTLEQIPKFKSNAVNGAPFPVMTHVLDVGKGPVGTPEDDAYWKPVTTQPSPLNKNMVELVFDQRTTTPYRYFIAELALTGRITIWRTKK
jgi:hypothetical protein